MSRTGSQHLEPTIDHAIGAAAALAAGTPVVDYQGRATQRTEAFTHIRDVAVEVLTHSVLIYLNADAGQPSIRHPPFKIRCRYAACRWAFEQ